MSDFSLSANLDTVFALEVHHLVCVVNKKNVKETVQDLLDLNKSFPITQALVSSVIKLVFFSGLALNIFEILFFYSYFQGKEERPQYNSIHTERDQARLQLLSSFLSLDTVVPGFASSIVDSFEAFAPGSFSVHCLTLELFFVLSKLFQ